MLNRPNAPLITLGADSCLAFVQELSFSLSLSNLFFFFLNLCVITAFLQNLQ